MRTAAPLASAAGHGGAVTSASRVLMRRRHMTAVNDAAAYYGQCMPPPSCPQLSGTVSADVCVVGGGLTGVTAALELALSGRSVALLEAGRIGSGASGRNGGQAVAGFAPPMERLEQLLGYPDARALWRAVCADLARLDAEVGDCAAQRGFVLAARRRRTLADLERWADAAQCRYGYGALQMLDNAGLADHVASPLFCGGLFDSAAWHLDPLALCRKRAAAAISAGAALYEYSSAVEMNGSNIRTRKGAVRADAVVLACDGGNDRLCRPLAARVAPVLSHVCVTAPLSAEQAARLMPSGAALCDDRRYVIYFRRTPDHRLLFGGGDGQRASSPQEIAAVLRPAFAEVFPDLARIPIDHAWSGVVTVTRNSLPDIGRIGDRIYYAQGYSGEGLILSGVAGAAVAAALNGDDALFALLNRIPHRSFPPLRALWWPLALRVVRLLDRAGFGP